MARVFISHASADLPCAVQLYDWLRHDGHEPFLDAGIGVGEEWKQRIFHELRHADAVVCVVTKAFATSNWCFAEVVGADLQGCLLLPLRAEPGVTHPLMTDRQYIDYHADPAVARRELGRVLRELDARGRRHWPDGNNPYPGLVAFTSALSPVFFGRSQETRELAGMVRAGRGEGLLAVVGPSGCGKSSLVHAGLLPALQARVGRQQGWLVVPPWMPGKDPLDELAAAVARTANQLAVGWSLAEIRERLAQGKGLRLLADELLARAERRQLLITIDQAEELFTRASESDRTAVATLLREATDGPVRVIATLRSEFLDELRTLPALTGMPIKTYVLAPLAKDMLPLCITEPARMAGLRVDAELVARLVSDTESSEALPLLAFALRELAMDLSRGDALSAERYRTIGGVSGALARHADEVLSSAATASGLTPAQVIAGLVRLATLDNTGRRSRRRVNCATLKEPLQKAMNVFVDQRLLTATEDKYGRWIGVAHEALLTAWPPLDKAITERVMALHAIRSVEQAAADWGNAGRAEHFLWDAERLMATETTLGLPASIDEAKPVAALADLNPDGHAFLSATRDRVRAVRHRERRRRRWTLSVLSVLLVLALAATTFAATKWGDANEERDIATARELVARAEAVRDSSPQLALRLGLAAYRLRPGPETNAGLVNTLLSTGYAGTLTGTGGSVSAVAFAATGNTLAMGNSDGKTMLWDLTHLAQPRRIGQPLTGHTGAVTSVAFAPDGTTMATASSSVTMLWDVANPAQPRQLGQLLDSHSGAVTSVAFSRDGRTMATGSSDSTATLWDLTDRNQPRQLGTPLTEHHSLVSAVAFAPTGNTMATASNDGSVILWDLTHLAQPRRIGQPLNDHTRNALFSVAFSADGKLLATGGSGNTATLWDLTDPNQPRQLGTPLTGHSSPVTSVAFSPTVSPTVNILATASKDSTTILWNVADPAQPKQVGQPLIGHNSPVAAVAFSPDGNSLATGRADGTVILWDLTDQPRPLGKPLTGHDSEVTSVRFAGDVLTTTSSDDTEIRWNIADPVRPRRLGQGKVNRGGGIYSLASSPDGTMDATGGADNSVILWDLTDHAHPRQLENRLRGHNSEVTTMRFAADGKTAATGGNDGTTILWDLTDHTQPRQLGQPQTGHSRPVTAIEFNADRTLMATGSNDGTTILWDTTDPTRPQRLGQPLAGHRMTVSSLAFAPNGKVLAAGSNDGTTILWDLTPLSDAAKRACAITGGFGPDEWGHHIPGISYRTTCDT